MKIEKTKNAAKVNTDRVGYDVSGMHGIVLFTQKDCLKSNLYRFILNAKKIPFCEIDVSNLPNFQIQLMDMGSRNLPVISYEGKLVADGGDIGAFKEFVSTMRKLIPRI